MAVKDHAHYALDREIHALDADLTFRRISPWLYYVSSETIADHEYRVEVQNYHGSILFSCECEAGTRYDFMVEPCKHAGLVALDKEERHEIKWLRGFWYSTQLKLEDAVDPFEGL